MKKWRVNCFIRSKRGMLCAFVMTILLVSALSASGQDGNAGAPVMVA